MLRNAAGREFIAAYALLQNVGEPLVLVAHALISPAVAKKVCNTSGLTRRNKKLGYHRKGKQKDSASYQAVMSQI